MTCAVLSTTPRSSSAPSQSPMPQASKSLGPSRSIDATIGTDKKRRAAPDDAIKSDNQTVGSALEAIRNAVDLP
jgi:hypothetical protein